MNIRHKTYVTYIFGFLLTLSVLGAEEIIGENHNYTATIGQPRWNTVTVTDKVSKRIVANICGDGELDGIGSASAAVFSRDGTLVAYSIGTSSSGREIRLFRLNPEGGATQLRPSDFPLDSRSGDHVYQKPLLFSHGKLLYDVSVDRKVSHFSYDLRTNKHILINK